MPLLSSHTVSYRELSIASLLRNFDRMHAVRKAGQRLQCHVGGVLEEGAKDIGQPRDGRARNLGQVVCEVLFQKWRW